jgi:hypothetical protein
MFLNGETIVEEGVLAKILGNPREKDAERFLTRLNRESIVFARAARKEV